MREARAEFLKDAASRALNDRVRLTVRQLLAHWGAKRRGYWIVEQIERELKEAGLTTTPEFTDCWIDNEVTLVPISVTKQLAPVSPSLESTEITDHALPDVALRVDNLPSANISVISVAPDSSLATAQSLMMRHDFSQLAVMSGSRNLRGAVSWESIAQARIRNPHAPLREAITRVETVYGRDNLLARVPLIMSAGFVFVLSKDKTIQGIVTTADLSQQFADLANPFFVLAEIERRLRRRINSQFTCEEIAACKNPRDTQRQVSSADDLTLGECVRLLDEPSRWEQLDWKLDRQVFIEALNDVRSVRNEVMHFSPDPLDSGQLTHLDNFVRWLRKLEPDA
ncbi:CBS domain-containing protein [Lentzea sp. NPDC003310]|uniref:CBS domain-containing protein n=1 Tax=Lentzea sp. NPDC003310 TaxID=3154447 RepID=UPI0033A103D6